MFITNHKISIVAAIAAVCLGFAGTDLITDGLVKDVLHGQIQELDEQSQIGTVVKLKADQSAGYIGGRKAMTEDLSDSFISPVNASEMEDEGKIIVRFLINTDGTVSSATVIRSISPAIESAVRSEVRKLTSWEPAIKNGVPVESTVVVPFKVN